MPLYSDEKWQKIERDFEKKMERSGHRRKSKIRKRVKRLLYIPPAPKQLPTLHSYCDVKGCPYPATCWAKDDLSVCRTHHSFYEWEAGNFISRSLIPVYLSDMRGIRASRRHVHNADDEGYSVEGLFLNGHVRGANKIRFFYDKYSSRKAIVCERVAPVFITTKRLESKMDAALETQERLRSRNLPWKEEIEAAKNLAVGGSIKICSEELTAFVFAKKFRTVLITRRATMFAKYSVKGDIGGFIVVTKLEDSLWPTDFKKPSILTGSAIADSQEKLRRLIEASGLDIAA